MGRGSAKGSSPTKKRGTRKAPAKRRVAPKRTAEITKAATPRRSSSKSKPAAATLAAKLKAVQARQAATSEILRIISQSPADAQPVFEAIVLAAVRMFGCDIVHFLRREGAAWSPVAVARPKGLVKAVVKEPLPVDPDANFPSRVILSRKNLYLPDLSKIDLPPFERWNREFNGINSSLLLPLLREEECIGVLAIASKHANAFDGSDIALAESFRDQALIAVENARLFNETKEALERQTAMADILKVIASSPSDVQPVFNAIADSARRLLGSFTAMVTRVVDGVVHLAASTAENEATAHATTGLLPYPLASDRIHARVARTGQVVSTTDIDAATHVPQDVKDFARTVGWRSMLVVPMLRNGVAIGTIGITRREPGSFDKAVDLLKTFADQAVIAVENVRLFNETREALERQTATADILKVIASSPDDVQPVFDAIVSSAARLIGAFSAGVYRFVGDIVHLAAITSTTPAGDEALRARFPSPIDETSFARAQAGEVSQVADTESGGMQQLREIARERGFRSIVWVPLRSSGTSIGAIAVSRKEPGPFAAHHIELLQTFADQAVIAIENVRLFNETKEALAHQTATSEVLQAIGSSMADTQPVFERILDSVERLFDVRQCSIILARDGMLHLVARRGTDIEDTDRLFPAPMAQTTGSEVIRTGRQVYVSSAFSTEGSSLMRRVAEVMGDYSVVMTPLVWEGQGIGLISAARAPNAVFSEKELALLCTFADQAVIAIQNARLFNETQESLQQQTATADVLKVISRSTFDLDAVLTTLTKSAVGLCRAARGAVFLRDGNVLRVRANAGTAQEFIDFLDANPIQATPQTFTGRTFLTGEIVHLPDVLADPDYEFGGAPQIGQFRSALGVPLVRAGRVEGVFSLSRPEPGGFTEREIELIRTFADQAVIAIENVRLFNEVQARTRELAASLDDLRATQGRLVQTEKLASLGQLTAGIAHEIKNPLNFVNNFSALSAELTDELNELLAQAEMTGKMREEVGELTKLLKDNLEKVVQHGKRADSIVKNMLLHSREGSGEQRLADINALVDESLNLAYHGARAEKSGFNVTLQRDFDAGAGSAELFPQEISRALLNLISNGFYAATKRQSENCEAHFEPMLLAATKDLGPSVEIRIRDNGTGIPPEVKKKMFNPFFTTKPAGEGTGLGLSMTHDIIVKQHGGRIDVETRPGEFTEFTIVLPRAGSPRPSKA